MSNQLSVSVVHDTIFDICYLLLSMNIICQKDWLIYIIWNLLRDQQGTNITQVRKTDLADMEQKIGMETINVYMQR